MGGGGRWTVGSWAQGLEPDFMFRPQQRNVHCVRALPLDHKLLWRACGVPCSIPADLLENYMSEGVPLSSTVKTGQKVENKAYN